MESFSLNNGHENCQGYKRIPTLVVIFESRIRAGHNEMNVEQHTQHLFNGTRKLELCCY